VFLDEAHKIKNATTATWKNVDDLECYCRNCLTGKTHEHR